MSWWIKNAQRAIEEIEDIQRLAKDADWLTISDSPSFAETDLIYEFEIEWSGESYPLRLHYPKYFPNVPARIVHRDGELISIHQYGKFGELCLKHRAENWNDSVMGSSMIEDAYALISGEHPVDGEKGLVPSGDLLTQGQQHHTDEIRFIQPHGCSSNFDHLRPGETAPILLLRSTVPNCLKLRVKSVVKDGYGNWISITPSAPGELEVEGVAANLANNLPTTLKPMNELISDLSMVMPDANFEFLTKMKGMSHFIDVSSDKWRSFICFNQTDDPAEYVTVLAPPSAERTPENYQVLREKKIAIVGCGSIGSKVAVSLARSGVRNFTLIDDDIFHEDNAVRNELDCQAIGRHKVDAVKESIERLPGNFTFVTKRMGLGRQNSALRTNAVLECLSQTDLIIDTTASPRAFNYIAAVSTENKISYIGCSIFSGGIGGLLFRARPDLDPVPAKAKAQIKAWRDAQTEVWDVDEGNDPYTYKIDEDVIVASDSDVTVMAGYCAQMAIDTLGVNTASIYPHSAYAIGFSNAWVFDQPFMNIPIQYAPEGPWNALDTVDPHEVAENFKKLVALITPKDS